MKIISGGQTGADQAGLDVALSLGLDYGGALPKGRKTETGPLSMKYDRMTELQSPSYPKRTKKNILDADVTLILTAGKISGGSALTLREARKAGKSVLHINLNSQSEKTAAKVIRSWLKKTQPAVLNVAGSRESKAPGIREKVYQVLTKTLNFCD